MPNGERNRKIAFVQSIFAGWPADQCFGSKAVPDQVPSCDDAIARVVARQDDDYVSGDGSFGANQVSAESG
jgi:hypothetical protein